MKLQCLIALLTVSTSSSLLALAQKVNHSVNHHCVAGVHDADNNACVYQLEPQSPCGHLSPANGKWFFKESKLGMPDACVQCDKHSQWDLRANRCKKNKN